MEMTNARKMAEREQVVKPKHRTPRVRSNESGYSLIELMVSIGILTVIMGGIFALLQNSQVILKTERNVLDSVQDMRGAFDMLTQEITFAGTGQVSDYGIVGGTANSLTLRGNFESISSIALTLDSASGTIVLGSATNFAAGQTVALSSNDSGKALWTTVSSVAPATKTIIVSTSTTPITSGAQLSDFGPGTMVDVIDRVQYTIDDAGTLKRTVSAELDVAHGTTTTLAENVLDADDNPALTFEYSAADGTTIPSPITAANASSVALVKIGLNVRTKDKDSRTNSYRNYTLSTYARPRS